MHQEFMAKVYLHPINSTSFKFPASHLIMLQDQVPKSALTYHYPPMLDANGNPCLVVFKNGAKTSTTIGKANNVSSDTHNYFAGKYQVLREWLVIPTNKYLGVFSGKGDSGSCVANAFSHVSSILTGGCGATESSNMTYITPISFIMKVLQNTKLFKHAHLDLVLA
jgi:hypothetical protein